MTIKFSSQKQTEIIEYKDPPVVQATKAFFLTGEKNWVNALLPASLSIKISAFNNKNNLLFSNQELLHLEVTPYHIQPVFEMNHFFRPSTQLVRPPVPHSSVHKWEVEITVHNLNFKRGESLTLDLLDRAYVLNQVADWENRVHNLIEQLSTWLPLHSKFQLRLGRKTIMHEGIMKDFDIPARELETADILKDGKLVLAIKPFGLWIMGANGRIDLLKATGNLILIDEAEHFQKPRWKVFLGHNRQQGLELSKKVFTEIISG